MLKTRQSASRRPARPPASRPAPPPAAGSAPPARDGRGSPGGPRRGGTGLGSASPSRRLRASRFPTEHEWGQRPLLSARLLSCPHPPPPPSARTDGPKPERSPSSVWQASGEEGHPWGFREAPRKSRGPQRRAGGYKAVYLPERHQPREAWQLATSTNFAPRLAGEQRIHGLLLANCRCQRGKWQCLPPLKSLAVSLAPSGSPASPAAHCPALTRPRRTLTRPGYAQPSQPPRAFSRVHTSHTCPFSPDPRGAPASCARPPPTLNVFTRAHPSPLRRLRAREQAPTRALVSRVDGSLAFAKPLAQPFSHTCTHPRYPLAHPSVLIRTLPHLPCKLTCRGDRQTDRHPASQTRPPETPGPPAGPRPGPAAEEGGSSPPASPPQSPALWTFVWLCG